jgi:hypothetical protein
MKRREMLAAVGASTAAGLAGCAGVFRNDDPTKTPADGQRIEMITPRRARRKKYVRVRWDDASNAVHVVGHMAYGRLFCDRPGIAAAEHDREQDEFFVRLEPAERVDTPESCSLAIGVSAYRATFQFDGALPGTVRVESANTASGGVGAETGTTARRTVHREAQESLCSGARPEDPEAAAKAHWTCPEAYLSVSGSDS